MPPRPRPRKATASSPPGPSSTTPLPPSSVSHLGQTDTDDLLFFKNHNRTAQIWNKLDKLTQEHAAAKSSASSDEDDGDGDDEPVRRRRQRKRTKEKEGARPKWAEYKAKAKEDAALIISSDSECDNDASKGTGDGGSHKRKRPRTRSRSITPPAPLPKQSLQNARDIIREALDIKPRAPSPTFDEFGDDEDSIQLDPELLAIQQRAAAAPATRANEAGGPLEVAVKVKWHPHPLADGAGRGQVWTFKVKRHDPLRVLFEETADEASVLVDNLVVTMDGSRVFASSTPHGLGIWAEAELDAYDKRTHEYLRTQRKQTPSPDMHEPPRSPSLPFGAHESSFEYSPDEQDDEGDENAGTKLKLTVRAEKAAKDVTLVVLSTTTCGHIVAAFLEKNDLADKYPDPRKAPPKGKTVPQIVVDGDKMAYDAPISDADLEDGDMVEVAGL